MLILTRNPGTALYIGDNVKITILDVKGRQTRIGIEAPKEVSVHREEIYERIRAEKQKLQEELRPKITLKNFKLKLAR